jgi:hypothetical protein
MDMSSLLWDETGRSVEAERLELARTAALNDIRALAGALVFQAADETDLGHRLALAEPHLQAVANRRGYPAEQLADDLRTQWALLAQTRAATVQRQATQRKVTAAQEQAMDAAVARLAARAARENPTVPVGECLRMATEAVAKHADAYPLAYESWGGTADGPFTDRAKNWKPKGMPGVKSDAGPAAAAAPSAATPPSSPAAAAAPDVPDHDAPFRAAAEELTPKWDAVTASWDWSKPFREVGDALRRRWDRTTGDPTGHAAEQDWHEDNKAWHENLDQTQHEMNQKWDANAASPGASPEHTTQHASDDLLHGFDQARAEMNDKWDANAAAPGASEGYRPKVPGGFSHTDTGHGGTGQAALPTDPAGHGFSHQDQTDTAQTPDDYVIPSHFQYGRP